MIFKGIDKNYLSLAEAIFAAAIATLLSYSFRINLVNFEGTGTTEFTWRSVGLMGGYLSLVVVYFMISRRWLGVALSATGIGIVYGLGVNDALWPRAFGPFWDIQALWFYLRGNLSVSHPSYAFYVSIAWVSIAGIGTALMSGILSFAILENAFSELRRSRSHNGTNKYRSRETVYGDADWGSWAQIKNEVGSPTGIVLGEDYDPRQNPKSFSIRNPKSWGEGGKAELITMSPRFASGHSLVFSGPGGGKTAGIVIPTCLNYTGSIIVVDPEMEILEATKAAREAMGRNVRVIKIGSGINLLEFLSRITERRDLIFTHLAQIITDPNREHTSEVSDYFTKEAKNLIGGLLNHFTNEGEENPFFEVLKVVSKQEKRFKEALDGIVATQDDGSLLRMTLDSYSEMETRTFTSFQSTIRQALDWAPYKELLNTVTTEPEHVFDPLDPNTDLFIQISKSDMQTFPGLVRLILGTLAYVIDEKPDGHERVMIVDEAFQVGRLKIFERIRDTSRKKHLHLMLIFQTSGQLESLYGRAGVRSWNDSMAARIYSTTEDPTDQEEISKMIGEYTVDIKGTSKSNSVRGFGVGTPTAGTSHNTSLQRTRLMRPEQLRTLPNDGLIIFFKGYAPIICGKAISFRRGEWQKYTPFKQE